MLEDELIATYIDRFNKHYGTPGEGYIEKIHIQELSASMLDSYSDTIAKEIVQYGRCSDPENLEQHLGVYCSYGLSLAVTELKSQPECLTHQEGFRDQAVIKNNLDEILNDDTDIGDEASSVGNIIEWCINPKGNIEISDDIFKGLLRKPITTIERTLLPGRKSEIIITIPPISINIDFPDWKSLLTHYKINNADIVITNYGHVFGVAENERSYLVAYQTDGLREFVLISGYELIRGRISCIGALAFDATNYDKEYELHVTPETKIELTCYPENFNKKREAKIVSDCHFIHSRFQAGEGFNSFLSEHSTSFIREMYSYQGTATSDNEEIAMVFRNNRSMQAIEVCSALLHENNIYNISLEDAVSVTNRLERADSVTLSGIMTSHRAEMGTFKGIGGDLDIGKIRNIPANFSTITWKLKDRGRKVVPYHNLEIGKYSDTQIIESIIKYYETASTEVIAEDYLYLFNKSIGIDPSAFFAAKLFLFLMTMDSLVIDSRNEEIKTIWNVDHEEYTPIKMPPIPNKALKMHNSTSGSEYYGTFGSRINGKYSYSRYSDQGIYGIKIENLDLSVRSYNCLKRAGIRTLGDLSRKSEADLMKIRNLGRRQINEILQKMKNRGVYLRKN